MGNVVDDWLYQYRVRYCALRAQGYSDLRADQLAKVLASTTVKVQWKAIRDGWRER